MPSAVSIGACSWPGHGDTERDLLHNADIAMYGAKHPAATATYFIRR